jgi:ribosome-associated translation inhibitor RaiA
MADTTSTATPDIRVTIGGGIAEDMAGGITADVQRRVGTVLDHLRQPVLSARVRVTRHEDPAATNPFTAQANVDLNGYLIRVQVAAPTPGEALAQLSEKLRRAAERVSARWKDRTGRRSAPALHEWRHISEASQRPSYYPRPPEDRRVLRHKSFGLGSCTADEAAFDMAELDYDFFLFTELGSGQDSVLYRTGPDSYGLAQLAPEPGKVTPGAVTLAISEQPAAVLTEAEAVSRLNLSGEPFLFFRKPDGQHRGRVLYRRYDGHYGLIGPAD